MNIATHYMGLAMPNPLIVSSSPLTENINAVTKSVNAGAGAVILKSLFEEDIAGTVKKDHHNHSFAYPEDDSYIEQMHMLFEPDTYLGLIEESVATVDVPVIASLNCHTTHWWVDYAERIARVGAAGIELNLSPIALDIRTDAKNLEKLLVGMIALARKTVNIPLAVKLGPNFTALPHLAHQLERAGANSLTLFNRFYKMDIDINSLALESGNSLSAREEFNTVLRWVGILSDITEMDLSTSTGVYGVEEVVKALLAGTQTVQVCSVVLKEGLGILQKILDGLQDWMRSHEFSSLDDFRGHLSLKDDQRNNLYQRLQYVKSLKGEK